jgi:hypothetical protein
MHPQTSYKILEDFSQRKNISRRRNHVGVGYIADVSEILTVIIFKAKWGSLKRQQYSLLLHDAIIQNKTNIRKISIR